MACKIAAHKPLEKLRKDIGAPAQCHSTRKVYVLKESRASDTPATMGIQGAAIGYCQGLFNKQTENPEDHTTHVAEQLKAIDAPFYASHELLMTQKPAAMSVDEYVRRAAAPLLSEGRIPVLITDYDAHRDYDKIMEVFRSASPVHAGESMLVRIALNDESSVQYAATLIHDAVREARSSGKMPLWWPLLQGGHNLDGWDSLRKELGPDFTYVTLAIHPFSYVKPEDASNIVVAQWLVGTDISKEGEVNLHIRGCLGSDSKARYNINKFSGGIRELDLNQTSIVCGASLPHWSETDNQQRLANYLPQFKEAVSKTWKLNDARELLNLKS